MERVLAFTELAPPTLHRLASVAQQWENYSPIVEDLRAARALYHEYFTAFERGDPRYFGFLLSSYRAPFSIEALVMNLLERCRWVLLKCSAHKVHARVLRYYLEWQQWAQQAWDSTMGRSAPGPLPSVPVRTWYEELWDIRWPYMPASIDNDLRRLLYLRLLRSAIAAELFRKEHGRWPSHLGELVPDYLNELPCDLYNAPNPLLLRRTAEGIVIYSVGENGTDDGGDPVRDYTFFLYDVEYRWAHRR
ncbi:MAG: hypothetical protein RMI91_00460 [Gemmatales bacterium]|nr:hypothetical protein [Gemmatales bacterium]MDW7993103.1 hypothetical protein [Gemmatales bacterium]